MSNSQNPDRTDRLRLVVFPTLIYALVDPDSPSLVEVLISEQTGPIAGDPQAVSIALRTDLPWPPWQLSDHFSHPYDPIDQDLQLRYAPTLLYSPASPDPLPTAPQRYHAVCSIELDAPPDLPLPEVARQAIANLPTVDSRDIS